MSLQGISSSKWFRPVAIAMSLAITGSTCAVGIEAIAKDVSWSLNAFVAQIQGPPRAAAYSGAVPEPNLGQSPGRRRDRGIWTPERKMLLAASIQERRLRRGDNLFLSIGPFGIFQDEENSGGGGGASTEKADTAMVTRATAPASAAGSALVAALSAAEAAREAGREQAEGLAGEAVREQAAGFPAWRTPIPVTS